MVIKGGMTGIISRNGLQNPVSGSPELVKYLWSCATLYGTGDLKERLSRWFSSNHTSLEKKRTFRRWLQKRNSEALQA